MKRFVVTAALLMGIASTAQGATITATVVPNPTIANLPFAVEDFGTGPGTGYVAAGASTASGLVVTSSGTSGIYSGDKTGEARSPFRTSTGAPEKKNYLNARAGSGNSLTLTYLTTSTTFDLLWGSVDPTPASYNTLTFTFSGGAGSETVTGADVFAAASGATSGTSNLAVYISGLNPYNVVSVKATSNAFEFSPRTRAVSVPDGGATLALLGGALMGLGILRRKFSA